MSASTEKPALALIRFAAALGWTKLRRHENLVDGERTPPQPYLITWCVSGVNEGNHDDLFLQINESPIGQIVTYEAAVYAMRYRLCSGWHGFTRFEAESEILAEVARLDAWLHKRWFEDAVLRRQYRAAHPECAGYSWKRIQEHGPPHLSYELRHS
jgi:hypothetical protein